MATLQELLDSGRVLLADGATGTNLFDLGLASGDAPELWNTDHPERIAALHQSFVDAGADIFLTNSFGSNRYRLALHGNEHRVHELSRAAAGIARRVADGAGRPIVVAGSVGPTGELLEPVGTTTVVDARAAFVEQIEGLIAGGIDVVWIETMSAVEEMQAAASAAIELGMPYVVTGSFDTAGRTMMGLAPESMAAVFDQFDPPPLAIGANCGVGASDILMTVLAMSGVDGSPEIVSKGNCGIPQFRGVEAVYSGTPELMARYAELAVDAGARIVGGCCGTSPEHLAAMRAAIDGHVRGDAPDRESIEQSVGPMVNAVADSDEELADRKQQRRSRRG